MTEPYQPLIVGMGGATRPQSTSEIAVRKVLGEAERLGARTRIITGPELDLPNYAPENPVRTENAVRLVDALRQADGLIIASPGYHGSLSGLIKNALDYVEDMNKDERVYLEGRAVGLIACAYGWQATGTTLVALRSIVHALRGWPTPLGVAINTAGASFDENGDFADSAVGKQLMLMAGQVVDFAKSGIGRRS